MDVRLNLINRSQDTNNTSYLIFQRNIAKNFGEVPVAWIVVKNLGYGDNHPFSYPMNFAVGAGDSWGNYTPSMLATSGQLYEMVQSNSGDVLRLASGRAATPTQVDLRNSLGGGAISANAYRNGLLLAQKTNISPGQKAAFEFQPRIFIGAVSQIAQGQVLNSAILDGANAEINLIGITSADIVITGGGGNPFVFTLANIN